MRLGVRVRMHVFLHDFMYACTYAWAGVFTCLCVSSKAVFSFPSPFFSCFLSHSLNAVPNNKEKNKLIKMSLVCGVNCTSQWHLLLGWEQRLLNPSPKTVWEAYGKINPEFHHIFKHISNRKKTMFTQRNVWQINENLLQCLETVSQTSCNKHTHSNVFMYKYYGVGVGNGFPCRTVRLRWISPCAPWLI